MNPRPPSTRRSASVRLGFACLLSGALLVPAGCLRHETPVQAGIRTGTLILGNGAEPEDLDPQVVTAYTDQAIVLALFEGLAAIDERTSLPVPAAASSWRADPGGLAWTFRLRPGLLWSNGEPLTAGDFVESWRRILRPSLGSEYAYLLYPIRNARALCEGRIADPALLGASAPDDRTLRITLERPTPYLPALTAQPPWFPVNPRVLARFGAGTRRGTAWTRPGNLVGNGPFILQEWTPNARIVVVRNPRYRDGASALLQRMIFLPWENPDAEERAFRAGQMHITFSIPVARLAAARASSSGELRSDPFLQTFFLRFNVTSGPLADRRVRRALSLALPREAIARAGLAGALPAAATLVPAGCGGYSPASRVPTDFDAARRLLAEAGHPGGAGLPTLEIQLRNNDSEPRVMEAVQAAWTRELGVRTSLVTLEQKTWLSNQQTLAYTISTSAWAGDFPDPVTFLDLFVSNGGNNWTGWSNSRYDRLIDEAANRADNPGRFACFHEAEDLLLREAPVAPLYFGARTYLIHPSVEGWEPALLGFHRYARVGLSAAPPP